MTINIFSIELLIGLILGLLLGFGSKLYSKEEKKRTRRLCPKFERS